MSAWQSGVGMRGGSVIEMDEIYSVLPHRPPFLFVDRILERKDGRWVRGCKNIGWNDWFLQEFTMPSTLIVESLAQLGALIMEEPQKQMGLLSTLNRVEVLGMAKAGDCLELYYEMTRKKGPLIKGRGYASINGKKILTAEEIGVFLTDL